MAENKMPAAEADETISHLDERNSYELAFHVLPTVAEGEVAGVFEEIKTLITNEGAEIKDEETPERIDLAYEITEKIEGKNKKFNSAYFGWVRFSLGGEKIEKLTEEVDGRIDLLRHIVIKLTKVEEMMPFRFHEARKSEKIVIVEDKEILTEATKEKKEEPKEVSSEELDESLEKITTDDDVENTTEAESEKKDK